MNQPVVEELFGTDTKTINRYVDILASRGVERGLIGPRESERLWERHIFNSVAVAPLIRENASIADVGSGAGLPGIALAIARPDLSIVLVEPLLRRSVFLTEVVEELALGGRMEVVRGRAEDCVRTFDVVTARAVAPLGKLVGWTKKMFLPEGELLALKGASAAEEVAAAATELEKSGLVADVRPVRAAANLEETFVVRVRGVSRETDL
ncbi:16S rRNA (guanine(527)-N(7))-methyltransferase RsmG [Propionimicrobium sp. PCR01-08-3]|uniref:16S rRNA (guanine(527)-N(7))-methyltransferase RsmG n=1 Tax=Propionimicrobium sp. PCR01-08-3 TaxID=3052086 RepID=UPI00255C624E|nr:16S rRNA (guanine(527)-N(7))-methyltransferase RsmG [Propionimicrobium sp. PCR01-08-3]WIY82600.1 16S rRNA (guanine(527)-N(7))-methyltransferase RsmG [Propionimicrobium sp. PCR01-08-3]